MPKVKVILPRRRAAVIFAIMAAGLGAALALHAWVGAWERDRVQSALAAHARERAQLLQTKILCSMEALNSISAFVTTRGRIDRKEFHDFVQSALERQPDLQALDWTPVVLLADRARYEAAAKADGSPHCEFTERDAAGRLVPAGRRDQYYPVYYIEPLKTNDAAVGFDLGSDPTRRKAIVEASRTGLAVATSLIHLVQEKDQELGFVVYIPVYRPEAIQPSERGLAGVASAVFRVDSLIRPAVEDLATEGLNVSVLDKSDGDRVIVQSGSGKTLREFAQRAQLSVAGRQWEIVLTPTPAFLTARQGGQSRAVLLTTLLATVALAGYLYAGFRRTAEIEWRVAFRTRQLSREVVDRKRAEGSARLAEARYRSIFENSIEGIFQSSPDGKYLSANPSLARIYGYDSIEELVAALTNIAGQLYVEPGRREEFIGKVHGSGAVSEFESQIYRKDGTVIWISENARAARDDHGRVLYYEGTVVDITERKIAEGSLRRNRDELESRVRERTLELAAINEALQTEIAVRKRAEDAAAAASLAKSAFLASMSHEIRTPMNAILGYAQILERDPSLRGMHREALQTVLSSGNHLLGLIDDVLEISKIEAGHAEIRQAEFDLDGLLRDVIGMFRQRCRQKGLDLRIEDLSGDPRRVIGDERKLRQALINLVGNAVKFTDQGSITVRVRPEQDERYRFEVIDTGIGIAVEACKAIFEAFNQGPTDHQRGGSGLGLAICRQHIELMGGTLDVSSSRDGQASGSTFSFAVTLATPAEMAGGPAPQVNTNLTLARGCSVRAIVVDDVPENRDVLAQMLAGAGCQVRTAETGAGAIGQMEDVPADIIFIDIMMPGMDGIETARQFRRRFAAQPVKLVAASASALAHERQEYLDAGFDDFLAKPVRYGQMNQLLQRLLGVEFEPQPHAETSPTDGISAPGLPAPLRDRLLCAASQYRITELRQCIEEIDRTPSGHAGLSDLLRRYLRRYDMEGIVGAMGVPPPRCSSRIQFRG
jgi:PAS domain S-box-containing protein